MDIITKGSFDFRDKVISRLQEKLKPLPLELREERFGILGLQVAQELGATVSSEGDTLTFIEGCAIGGLDIAVPMH